MKLDEATKIAKGVSNWLLEYCHKLEIAGSIRRQKEDVRDIDLIALPKHNKVEPLVKQFITLADHVSMRGNKKCCIVYKGISIDLNICPYIGFWGAFRLHHTGSKAHNIKLRSKALSMGYNLNQYCLKCGDNMIAGKTEEEVFEALELEYKKPEERSL